MNKLFGLYLILFLLSLAASYKFTGNAKFREVWKTCNNNGTQVVCNRNPLGPVICGSDGKSYSGPSMIRCLNECLPEEEQVKLQRLGFCEPEYQEEYLKPIKMAAEQFKKIKN
ncbi:uncharacterized protein LOC123317344 isoform X1 [Coccinella septempunctata]|uniref:uncharacterized protein LOC123317344 isoform X1 n=1 Tax=Coccinella septempunctata TaxID=41139 RepID=UPI001D08DF66|nr:uncharacterized protein LOC123317344 isoform X1 [Coccinella septempunctata]